MEEWKEYKLSDLSDFIAGFAFKSADFGSTGFPVVKIKDIQPPFVNVNGMDKVDLSPYNINKLEKFLIFKEDFVMAMTGATIGKIGRYINEEPAYLNQRVLKFIPKDQVDAKYIYYSLLTKRFQSYINNHIDSESAQPNISANTIGKYELKVPNIQMQRKISCILKSLDDKIELNHRINENLEQQAQALFNYYFIEHSEILGDYEKGNLTEIATYTNGLPMQKFRPQDEEKGMPVLKIKELGQGQTDNSSDICSENIDNEYKITNGDVIFSWSGTLMVKVWCGGLCGLNQHLFKITSEKYPKWYYYFWTKFHLNKFIRIAQDKAVTMGHIRRKDLETSEVLIPKMDILAKLNEIINPIFNQIIEIECENKNLAQLRDTLLPHLMSGKLAITDIDNKKTL